MISKLLDIADESKLCFIGSRVNFIRFDEPIISKSEDQYPLSVEVNSSKEELIMATSKEIRFMDIKTGRFTKIFTGILNNSEDELTIFKPIR